MYVFDCFGDKITSVFMATEIPTVTVVALIATVANMPVITVVTNVSAVVVATWVYVGLGTITERKRRSLTLCGQFLICFYCC
jgi:hypothetical protein